MTTLTASRAAVFKIAWGVLLAIAALATLNHLVLSVVMAGEKTLFLGWVVGAPRAADRFTMVTVMAVGNLGAALAGGAVLGGLLRSKPAARPAIKPDDARGGDG